MQVMTTKARKLYSDILRLCDGNYWVFDRAFATALRNDDGVIAMDDLLASIVVAHEEYDKQNMVL